MRAIELDTVLAHHVLEAPAAGVDQISHRVGVERPRHSRAAEQAATEAGTLLVRPVDECDRHGEWAARGRLAQHLERRHHAERAVEPAAVRHRVHVRADDDRVGPLAVEHGPDVAGLVDVDAHGKLREATSHELARTHPLIGPAHAPRAIRPAGQLGEPAQVGDHARRVESRRAHVGVALPRSCGMISRP